MYEMFPTHVGIARQTAKAGTPRPNVPYACGDCAYAIQSSGVPAGCSLRMWGLRGSGRGTTRRPRMFPTHVGIARRHTTQAKQPGNVPYACGDCARSTGPRHRIRTCSLRMWGLRGTTLTVHGQTERWECSLRMWGLRALVVQTRGHLRMFPTHVGIARIWIPDADSRTHVPYACGDCAETGLTSLAPSPCSLRMWGLRGVYPRVCTLRYMFPTHVGIARRLSDAAQISPHVPYACGDCAGAVNALGLRRVCSLRMWGLRVGPVRALGEAVMFPTHVGIARIVCTLLDLLANVPYACGDCADKRSRSLTVPPCSLRMWGLRVLLSATVDAVAMFPTHVGIAREPSVRNVAREHVPYACGDCACAPGARADRRPCSLRMWGLRGLPFQRQMADRMFPTHVGIARGCAGNLPRAGDVPYACGDCAYGFSEPLEFVACSLRMWGLRGRAGRRRRRAQMFPTHVGIARSLTCVLRSGRHVPYACGDCAWLSDYRWALY